MTKKQVSALVDDMLESAANDACSNNAWDIAHGQGMYHAAMRIADRVDSNATMSWPWFGDWRDMLVASTKQESSR